MHRHFVSPIRCRSSRRASFRPIVAMIVLVLTVSSLGCATPIARYTSEDLALLPCDRPDKRMFFPLEVQPDTYRFPDSHFRSLRTALRTRPSPAHILVFVHGWNKTASVAEREYADFICRMHTAARERTGQDDLLIVGVFWRSTWNVNWPDPTIIKPFTYYLIRDRADAVADIGFSSFLDMLSLQLFSRRNANPNDTRPAIHLVGHSFGGRILVRSMREFVTQTDVFKNTKGPIVEATAQTRLAMSISSLDIALVNAAIAPSQIDSQHTRGPRSTPLDDRGAPITFGTHSDDAVIIAERERALSGLRRDRGGHATYLITDAFGGRFFNFYSDRDTANSRLFPAASVFSSDPVECAAGACPVRNYDPLVICDDGRLEQPDALDHPKTGSYAEKGPFNVDVSNLILDHTDIFKGRVVAALADVLFGPTPLDKESSKPINTQERGCPRAVGAGNTRAVR